MDEIKDLEWLVRSLDDAIVGTDGGDWDGVKSGLLELHSIEPNWDGEGADPPHPQAIADASKWLAQLKADGFPAPGCAYPVADGSVFIEWMFPGEIRLLGDCNPREPGLVDVMIFWPPKAFQHGTMRA